MTVSDLIIDYHKQVLMTASETLLGALSEPGDKSSDINTSLVKEVVTKGISMSYDSSASHLLRELEKREPIIVRNITVNQARRDRVERSLRAVEERQSKKAEYIRKLKSLRKSVPDKIRESLI
jgi:hypothetical protein